MTDAEGGGSGRQTQIQKEWTLPDSEYRKWVRENVSSGLTRWFVGTGVAGFLGLYFTIVNFGSDTIASKAAQTVKTDLGGIISGQMADLLLNKAELIKRATADINKIIPPQVVAYLASEKGEAGLLEAITNNKIVEETILKRSQQVATGTVAGSSFAQRAQALQLVVVFQPDQAELRKTISDVLSNAAAKQDIDDQSLVNVALDSYQFSDARTDTGRAQDVAALTAVGARLASEPKGSTFFPNYRRFLSRVPSAYLPEVGDWLRQNSDRPGASVAAAAVFERADGDGVSELVKMLASGMPLSSWVLAAQTLASGKTPPLQREARRSIFTALWRLRTDPKLGDSLQEPRADLSSSFRVTEREMSTNRLTNVDLVALKYLRAEANEADWQRLLLPLFETASSRSKAILLRLWLKRMDNDFGSGPDVARARVEASAKSTLETLTRNSRWRQIEPGKALGIIKQLLVYAPLENAQAFVEGYPGFFRQASAEDGDVTAGGVLAVAIGRDGASTPPYKATFSLLEGLGPKADALATSFAAALVQHIGSNSKSPDKVEAADLLASLGDMLNSTASSTKLALAALVLETAARAGDERKVRAALYGSGALFRAAEHKNVEPRLADIAKRLADKYPTPVCGPSVEPREFAELAEGKPLEIGVADGSIVRLGVSRFPSVAVSVAKLVADQAVDVFFWDRDCRRTLGLISESQLTTELLLPPNEPIFVQTVVARPLDNTLNLHFEVAKEIRLVAGRQPFPLAAGWDYVKTEDRADDNGDRFYTLVADAPRGSRLWLATTIEMDSGADTQIDVFDGVKEPTDNDETVATNDDISDDLWESALILEPSADKKYVVRISTSGGTPLAASDTFRFRTFLFDKPLTTASQDRGNAPTIAADVYTEIDTGPTDASRWIAFEPAASGLYEIDYFASPVKTPTVFDAHLVKVDEFNAAEREDGGLHTFAFRLNGGEKYLVQVAPIVNERAVVRFRAKPETTASASQVR